MPVAADRFAAVFGDGRGLGLAAPGDLAAERAREALHARVGALPEEFRLFGAAGLVAYDTVMARYTSATAEQWVRLRETARRYAAAPDAAAAYAAAHDAAYAAPDVDAAYAAAYAAYAAAPDADDATDDAAYDAVLALLARDHITTEQFDILYGPWRGAFGEPVALNVGCSA